MLPSKLTVATLLVSLALLRCLDPLSKLNASIQVPQIVNLANDFLGKPDVLTGSH